jgi:pantothenate kinase
MPKKNNYPSYKNPIILGVSGSSQSVKSQLIELEKRIVANEKDFQRKNDKIPAFWFLLPTAYLPQPFISS